MQGVGTCIVAEDSCFIKHHPQNDDGALRNTSEVPPDVEKATDGPVHLAPGEDEKDPAPQVSSKKDLHGVPPGSIRNELSMTATDDFPEGAVRAWMVVVGAFCGTFAVFGLINSTGVLLEYFQEHQLKHYSSSQIGWLFGLELFLTFFCGAPVGPVFDAYGPRALVFAGSVLLVASMFLIGLCSQYWHFFLVYSVLSGFGGALVYSPCIASIGHFFLVKRGNATGIAMTSGSIGGIIFPLMLQRLFPMVGFAWATRIVGFILVFLLVIANILVRSRLPSKPMSTFRSVSPDLTVLKDLPFVFVTLGIFLMEWGIFVPLTYITTYAVSQGFSTSFSLQILAILNAGSVFGRFSSGLVADMIGRMNTLILSIGLCVITCLALWLPTGHSTAMIIVFAIIFGFVSGSNLSLSPVCVGQLCKTENYGRYFATCWMFVAFGALTGLPIAGQILTSMDGEYWGLIVFAGLAYAAAMICLITARVLAVGWRVSTVY